MPYVGEDHSAAGAAGDGSDEATDSEDLGLIDRSRRPPLDSGAADESRRMFQKLWTDADEMKVLQGFYEFTSRRGTTHANYQHDTGPFFDDIRPKLQFEFNKNQIVEKLRRLKKKYRNAHARIGSGKGSVFKSPHDRATYEISRKIWSTTFKRKPKSHPHSDASMILPDLSGAVSGGSEEVLVPVAVVESSSRGPQGIPFPISSALAPPLHQSQPSFLPLQQSQLSFLPLQQSQSPLLSLRPSPSTQQPSQSIHQPSQSTQQPSQLTQQLSPPSQQLFPPAQQPFPPAQQPFPPAQQPFPPAQQFFTPTQQPFPSAQHPSPPITSKAGLNVEEEALRICLAPLFKELVQFALDGSTVSGSVTQPAWMLPVLTSGTPSGEEDERWRRQRILELELYLKRVELVEEAVRSTLEKLKSTSS